MMWEWDEFNDDAIPKPDQPDPDSYLNFDFFSALSKPKDYYKILEVDYDATDDAIRSNYIRLALKWHPDKQKNQDSATSRFQEINEAYQDLWPPSPICDCNFSGDCPTSVSDRCCACVRDRLMLVSPCSKLSHFVFQLSSKRRLFQ